MTIDLSRIWDSEPNQPLKWLEWAPETPIRGPGGPKVASKVLNMWGSALNPFLVHQKIENSKMLRMKFWTSENLVKKWSKRPRDPHNRIRLEKLCPKVVSVNVNFSQSGIPPPCRRGHMRPCRRGHMQVIQMPPAIKSIDSDILERGQKC